MSETALTPDVEAADRPFADGFDPRPNLIGMDRDDIAAALLDMGEAEKKVRMRAPASCFTGYITAAPQILTR